MDRNKIVKAFTLLSLVNIDLQKENIEGAFFSLDEAMDLLKEGLGYRKEICPYLLLKEEKYINELEEMLYEYQLRDT